MCIYLFYQIRKARRNRKARAENSTTQPAERVQAKQESLCEHQLADAAKGSDDGVLNSTIPGLEHQQRPVEQRGSKHCPECIAEKKRARIYRSKVLVSLVTANIMASMDLTIIATALPTIASHFSALAQFNWLVTAFTLASTSSIPLYGQISDVFGRHTVLQASIFFILIGSALAGGAQAWAMLLVGRALQGLGFAGLQIVTKIILSDKVSLKDTSFNNTLFTFLNGVGFSIGPVIGGYLARSNWRWCFIINVPIAVLSHITVFFLLRKELVKAQPHRHEDADGVVTMVEKPTLLAKLSIIDYGGMLLFFFGAGLIVLAVTWGGATYPWSSSAVLVPLIIGGLMLLSFFVYEHLMVPGRALSLIFPSQEPMVPLSLFRTKDMGILAYLNFSTGMAMFSVFYFVGIWFTIVQKYDSGKAGVQLIYYTPGLGVGAYTAMFLCNIWPKYTFWPLFFGSTLEPLGVGMLTWALSNGRIRVVDGMLGFAGVGTGLRIMPGLLHAIGLRSRFKARCLATMSFTQVFGGTVGIAIMASVFNNKLSQFVSGVAHINPHNTSSVGNIDSLPPALQAQVRAEVNNAVFWAYVSILPFLSLAGVLVFFLGNVKITARKQDSHGEIDGTENVENIPYLWWLATAKRRGAAQSQTLVEALGEKYAEERRTEGKSTATG